MNYSKNYKAFTLAEVLITLAIIGVVAGLTIATTVNKSREKIIKKQYLKAYTVVSQALALAVNELGYNVRCFYWEPDANPNKDVEAMCVSYDVNGDCSSYKDKKGNPLPADYNGYGSTAECQKLSNAIKSKLKIIKTCKGNGLKNGCLPDYNGIDTVYKINNTTGGVEPTAYKINQSTSGCAGFRKKSILEDNNAYVLADGLILFAYSNSWDISKLFALDTNGKKPPNKWGHDVFAFTLKGSKKHGPRLYPGGCYNMETGGVSGEVMWKTMTH